MIGFSIGLLVGLIYTYFALKIGMKTAFGHGQIVGTFTSQKELEAEIEKLKEFVYCHDCGAERLESHFGGCKRMVNKPKVLNKNSGESGRESIR